MLRTRRYGVSTNHNVSTQNPGKINRTLVQLIFRTIPFLLAVFRSFTHVTAISVHELRNIVRFTFRNVQFLCKNPSNPESLLST